ncbi:hypothetical protein Tco_0888909 [Tanacetum coccineum]
MVSMIYAIHQSYVFSTGTDIYEKDEKRSQNDKTGHGMEKRGKDKVKTKPKMSSAKAKAVSTWSSLSNSVNNIGIWDQCVEVVNQLGL